MHPYGLSEVIFTKARMKTVSQEKPTETYDYVIVGAGSAGCVLANRLSADRNVRVLLLEAGGTDINHFVAAPVGETQLLGTSYDWAFKSEPEPRLGGAVMELARGRCLGGSSSINGQLYFRGHPGDYDEWAALGNTGWAYQDILPLFKNMERWIGGENEHRGGSGPVSVIGSTYNNPLFEAFVQAGIEMGHDRIEDFNSPYTDGFGHCQHSHYRFPVLRCSASYAYLLPARFRRNLTIKKHAEVQRVLIDGNTATGVIYARKGQNLVAMAKREVVLSAGPYQSPKILMLSGIGPGAHLSEHGIETIADLPGVGENLQDQIGSFVQHECTQPITYYNYTKPLRAAAAAAEWLLLGRGPLTLFPMAATAMLRSSSAVSRPDLQFYMFPVAVNPHSEGTFEPRSHAYNIHWGVIHPKSRGTVRLRSNSPDHDPVIRHNYFSAPEDRELNRKAFRMAREIHRQDALAPYRGAEVAPGPPCQTDADIDDHTSRYFANHYHASGTCKMGIGNDAVTDPQLRVRGIKRLRVIDSSIMPVVVSGGLNAASMMIGEKGSRMLIDTWR